MDLQPHQQAALRQLRDGKILWGRVGSGKSRVAVAYYRDKHPDKDVYVITTAKKRDSLDWEKEFAAIAVGKAAEVCVEDPIPNSVHGTLTIDSWNNLHKYKDVKDAFFIFDEQRLVGAGEWAKSFLKIAKNNRWILLSATPGDTWLDYIPVFIANGFYKNRTAFKNEHVVYAPYTKFPKVIRYLNVGKLVDNRNQILVHMRYANEKIRRSITVIVDHNQDLLQSIIKNRWHVYENRPIRDVTELFGVMRKVVNSDPSRLNNIEEILGRHKKVIVFYNFNYELDILRRLDKEVAVGEWNGWRHDPIPSADSWLYLVQYVAGSESWNCVETNTIAFYSYTYSYKMWTQAHGRIDRMNTPFSDLYYYTLRSKSVVDAAIWSSLRAKKNFNAGKYPLELLKESTDEITTASPYKKVA